MKLWELVGQETENKLWDMARRQKEARDYMARSSAGLVEKVTIAVAEIDEERLLSRDGTLSVLLARSQDITGGKWTLVRASGDEGLGSGGVAWVDRPTFRMLYGREVMETLESMPEVLGEVL